MSEVLLAILNETIAEVAEEMRSVQAVLDRCAQEVQGIQTAMQLTKGREESAIAEDEHALQRLEVLRTYLHRLDKHPQVLVGKLQRLAEDQERTAQARRVVGGQLASAHKELRDRQIERAVAEHRYAELYKQWNEVLELLSCIPQAV
jgi:hypothetical protein